jgi:Double zinc ribbon
MPESLKCPVCGFDNPSGNKFCHACGARLQEPASLATADPAAQTATSGQSQEPAPPEISTSTSTPAPPANAGASSLPGEQERAQSNSQFCIACGAALDPGTIFCRVCGASAGQPPQTSVAAESAAPARAFAPAPAPPISQQGEPFANPPGNSSAIAVITVLLLAVIGAAGWLVWRHFARPDVTVVAIPKRIHVAAGGRTALAATISGADDKEVDWSIQEGTKGGQVTPLGIVSQDGELRAGATYSAPLTDGIFHVIATSHANSSRTATVEVIVGDALQSVNPVQNSSAPDNSISSQVVGVWRWPADDLKMTLGAEGTIAVTSETNPQKNLNGTYRFNGAKEMEIDFGNGDHRKWEILAIDSNYLRVSAQTKDGASAMVFVRLGN